MEDELATRIEVVEKLRIQSRDSERETREMHRRYNEQVCVPCAVSHCMFLIYLHTDIHFRVREAGILRQRAAPQVADLVTYPSAHSSSYRGGSAGGIG
jgi:hypothetical protein